jgi:preprotein translocase subunit SecD
VPGETTTTTAPTTTTSTPPTTTTPPTTAEGEPAEETPEEARPCPAIEPDETGQIPTTRSADRDRDECEVVLPGLEEDGETIRYILGPSLLTGNAVDSASSSFTNSEYVVDVDFTDQGGEDFVTKVAEPYVGQQVAIALDGVVQSAPTINQGITGDSVQISGSFGRGEAEDLATILRFGALPVQLEEQTTQNVSPTLGQDQLDAGIVAGLVGLALVALYMLLFYRLLGLVVIAGLSLTGIVMWCLVCYLGRSIGLALTLAGVTGLIVSVGVTVDSYIVYFERLKDEVRSGKTVRSSVDRGFTAAFRTILAADIVSLIGAAVLYSLAVGSVRGFALFLGLSTVVDLLVTYFFMHPLVIILARKRALLTTRYIGISAGLDAPEATI